jgi:hypothetical protein
MKIEYDPEVDALYVRLTESKIIESERKCSPASSWTSTKPVRLLASKY